MTSFIDTHCHLEMLAISPEEAIANAQAQGVCPLITIATEEKSMQFVRQMVDTHPQVYGSLGVHPHESASFSPSLAQKLHDWAKQTAKIVAIGETGLDYHHLHSEKRIQQTAFRQQLELAEQLQFPIVLHTREAEEDTLGILKECPISRKGVAHSFTSRLEMAKSLLDMGWYIGFNGIATFRNAEEVREVMRYVPLDRLLLETDAPFLTPVPFRGKPNEPAKIPVIAEYIAQARQIPLETLAAQTTENGQRLFGLPQES